jgi:hypothetical protein
LDEKQPFALCFTCLNVKQQKCAVFRILLPDFAKKLPFALRATIFQTSQLAVFATIAAETVNKFVL